MATHAALTRLQQRQQHAILCTDSRCHLHKYFVCCQSLYCVDTKFALKRTLPPIWTPMQRCGLLHAVHAKRQQSKKQKTICSLQQIHLLLLLSVVRCSAARIVWHERCVCGILLTRLTAVLQMEAHIYEYLCICVYIFAHELLDMLDFNTISGSIYILAWIALVTYGNSHPEVVEFGAFPQKLRMSVFSVNRLAYIYLDKCIWFFPLKSVLQVPLTTESQTALHRSS